MNKSKRKGGDKEGKRKNNNEKERPKRYSGMEEYD